MTDFDPADLTNYIEDFAERPARAEREQRELAERMAREREESITKQMHALMAKAQPALIGMEPTEDGPCH